MTRRTPSLSALHKWEGDRPRGVYRAPDPLTRRLLMESGFEPGALSSRGRHLTTAAVYKHNMALFVSQNVVKKSRINFGSLSFEQLGPKLNPDLQV
ncbi:hypothetical protein AVEN_202845-1 [Araneus ventricosus]|uniref:Uncharacterized protein n=1 Tax=Araneus ventricosus TaxID=182803 RepID=A0A4Y2DLI8_ARAVE|nr:hypothetical protein AVEN_202845-1 [Araneus ventricosus]